MVLSRYRITYYLYASTGIRTRVVGSLRIIAWKAQVITTRPSTPALLVSQVELNCFDPNSSWVQSWILPALQRVKQQRYCHARDGHPQLRVPAWTIMTAIAATIAAIAADPIYWVCINRDMNCKLGRELVQAAKLVARETNSLESSHDSFNYAYIWYIIINHDIWQKNENRCGRFA